MARQPQQRVAKDPRSPRSKRWDWTFVWAALSGLAWGLFVASKEVFIGGLAGTFTVMAIVALLRAVRRTAIEVNAEAARQMTQNIRPPHRVRNKLLPDERILWMTNMHPLGMLRWWLGFVVAAPLAVGAFLWLEEWLDVWYAGFVPAGILAFCLGCRVWVWRVERLCLTNHRLLAVRGIFSTEEISLPIQRITDTSLNIPWHSHLLCFLRLIGAPYGTFASENKKLRFVPYAEVVNRLVMQLMMGSGPTRARGAGSRSPRPGSGPGVGPGNTSFS